MAIAFDSASGHHSTDTLFSGAGTTITSNIDIVAGQCVVICTAASNDTTAPTVTDTYGNNYGASVTLHSQGANGMATFVLNGVLGGTGGHITAVFPSNGQQLAINAVQYSGVLATSFTDELFSSDSGGSTTQFQFATDNGPMTAGDVVVGQAWDLGDGNVATDTGHGFTARALQGVGSGSLLTEDLSLPSGGLFSLWGSSGGSSVNWIMALVALKAASGAPITQNLDISTRVDYQKKINRGDASRTTRWTLNVVDLWNKRRSSILVPRGFYLSHT